ncbi:unnamed protein product, partial [Urochloa humidicola]
NHAATPTSASLPQSPAKISHSPFLVRRSAPIPSSSSLVDPGLEARPGDEGGARDGGRRLGARTRREGAARRRGMIPSGGGALAPAMRAAVEALKRMVGSAPGTAGCAPGAEESSAPVSSRYSGDDAASLSTNVGATLDLPPMRSWCRAGFRPPPPSPPSGDIRGGMRLAATPTRCSPLQWLSPSSFLAPSMI